MEITEKIAEELDVQPQQVAAAVRLIDEGCTIPFIARYRKEVTGSLNDEVLRRLDERLRYLRGLEERKSQVLARIAEEGALTPELKKKVEQAETLVAVEDLYLPYKKKRKTRASVAKERGLGPLADILLSQSADRPMEEIAAEYVNAEKEVPDAGAALAGACDIIAETVSEDASCRAFLRDAMKNCGDVIAEAKKPEQSSVYENYYHYHDSVRRTSGHRVLALDRGEKEKILTVRVDMDEDAALRYLKSKLMPKQNEYTDPCLTKAAEDAWRRLLRPAIERDIRREMTESAQEGAIRVFGRNLEQLLMQPPITGQTVLGWDPAFRTGCKLAVVDPSGKVLDTKVIYPTAPQNRVAESERELHGLIQKYHITLISLGNGTASRESEKIIADFLHRIPEKVQYVIVSEAGASVYSASELATEEFPEFDVGQRSAASIARRLQDPLAELVKIDPRSIGVGQYQHDMDQKKLGEVLSGVVESCVNQVGVDLNTASAALLEYISGISKTVAKNIVAWREENGRFDSRKDLKKVPKLGPKAFEQCAGFLRVTGGSEPLDGTSVHPESYRAASALLRQLGYSAADIARGGIPGIRKKVTDTKNMAESLGIGQETLTDILAELEKPGRDPRSEMPRPVLRSDVMEMKDLVPGMILTGTVRNIVDFGAFVDIGVHQDGLVHISQMSRKRIRHPLDVVRVGDVVKVQVLSVDLARKRISLTMKLQDHVNGEA